ncbi:hypothetical protein BGZ99_008037 [Dissophora globulifera]|uniref:Uncharacterized protein n=1 Tax=Dissophora globulifera TaxID=979702 RepID=A0A9P6RVM3_9FUNG|nr:hypothetical protein BGZ99_008037 [Dissophora globulifera]
MPTTYPDDKLSPFDQPLPHPTSTSPQVPEQMAVQPLPSLQHPPCQQLQPQNHTIHQQFADDQRQPLQQQYNETIESRPQQSALSPQSQPLSTSPSAQPDQLNANGVAKEKRTRRWSLAGRFFDRKRGGTEPSNIPVVQPQATMDASNNRGSTNVELSCDTSNLNGSTGQTGTRMQVEQLSPDEIDKQGFTSPTVSGNRRSSFADIPKAFLSSLRRSSLSATSENKDSPIAVATLTPVAPATTHVTFASVSAPVPASQCATVIAPVTPDPPVDSDVIMEPRTTDAHITVYEAMDEDEKGDQVDDDQDDEEDYIDEPQVATIMTSNGLCQATMATIKAPPRLPVPDTQVSSLKGCLKKDPCAASMPIFPSTPRSNNLVGSVSDSTLPSSPGTASQSWLPSRSLDIHAATACIPDKSLDLKHPAITDHRSRLVTRSPVPSPHQQHNYQKQERQQYQHHARSSVDAGLAVPPMGNGQSGMKAYHPDHNQKRYSQGAAMPPEFTPGVQSNIQCGNNGGRRLDGQVNIDDEDYSPPDAEFTGFNQVQQPSRRGEQQYSGPLHPLMIPGTSARSRDSTREAYNATDVDPSQQQTRQTLHSFYNEQVSPSHDHNQEQNSMIEPAWALQTHQADLAHANSGSQGHMAMPMTQDRDARTNVIGTSGLSGDDGSGRIPERAPAMTAVTSGGDHRVLPSSSLSSPSSPSFLLNDNAHPQRGLSRRISFVDTIEIIPAYRRSEYNRRSDKYATFKVLTPDLKTEIRDELNNYKMREMAVHVQSMGNTAFH